MAARKRKAETPPDDEPPRPRTELQLGDGDPLRHIFTWVVSGQSEADITEAIQQHWPGLTPKPLIVEVMNQIMQTGQGSDEQDTLLRGWCIEATRELYRRMVDIGDFTGALAAVRALQKQTG